MRFQRLLIAVIALLALSTPTFAQIDESEIRRPSPAILARVASAETWTALQTFNANIVMLAGTDIRPSADSTTAINIANAAGTDFVKFDTTNLRVGVGITGGPNYRLESLQGTGGVLPGLNIAEQDTTNRRATIGFGLDSGTTLGWIMGQSFGNNTIQDFYISDVTAGVARFLIDTAGLVGINKSSSLGAQLHVLSGAAARVGLIVDTAASATASAQEWKYNGTRASALAAKSTETTLVLDSRDFGNNTAGPGVIVGRNIAAGTEGPAAGYLRLVEADDGDSFIWVDATGKVRFHTAAPTGSSGSPTVSDTAGVVLGDQTSWHAEKNRIRQRTDTRVALNTILDTKIYDYTFKASSYLDSNDRPAVFTGPIGYERSDWFLKNVGRQQEPSLNEINLHGYTVLAIQELEKRISKLERKK